MVYSFWAVFVLVIVVVSLMIRSTKAKYLQAKAEEQKRAELEARMSESAEGLMPERNQGQDAPMQGRPDFSRVLGSESRQVH